MDRKHAQDASLIESGHCRGEKLGGKSIWEYVSLQLIMVGLGPEHVCCVFQLLPMKSFPGDLSCMKKPTRHLKCPCSHSGYSKVPALCFMKWVAESLDDGPYSSCHVSHLLHLSRRD